MLSPAKAHMWPTFPRVGALYRLRSEKVEHMVFLLDLFEDGDKSHKPNLYLKVLIGEKVYYRHYGVMDPATRNVYTFFELDEVKGCEVAG